MLAQRDERGVVTLTLNRPEVRNAFGPELMDALRGSFDGLRDDPTVRCVVLTGAGTAFSAGADLNWMRSMAGYDYDDNVADSRRLHALFRSVDTFPRPVVARVNGPAVGGAVGLVACADVAVAARDAKLGFTEVRLGLAPAVVSTYVQPKIGVGAARRYFLTGERFDAERAAALGLVHEVCDPEQLDAAVAHVVEALLAAGPQAQAEVKALVRHVEAALPDADRAAEHTVHSIARLRVSAEGQEGMAAFFARRSPGWVPDRGDAHDDA